MFNKTQKKLQTLIKMQQNESCEIVVRKHWFIFVRDVAAVFFGTLFLWILLGVFLNIGHLNNAVIVYWQALVILVGTVSAFVIWTNYWLDMWIVTNKRVIHVDQRTLFSRVITATRIDRVQDVKAQVKGFVPTMLGFGNLQVQTAGASSANMLINGIPKPNDVRRIILQKLDHALDSAHNHDGIGHN